MTSKKTTNDKSTPRPQDNTAVQDPKNFDPEVITQEIGVISKSIINQAEALRAHVSDSEIQRSLQELRDATTVFKAMADTAAQQTRLQSHELIRPPVVHVAQPQPNQAQEVIGSPIGYPQPRPPKPSSDCNCSRGCGDESKPSCCVQLYISKVKVLEGQSAPEFADKNQLELIIAVQAQESWGLVPGLSSNLGVNAKSGWVAIHGPISKFCVPCNKTLTIPLFVEVMEVETTIAGGRPEFGSNTGAIVLRCDCEIVSQRVEVLLDGGGTTEGKVEIEISGKRVGGGCC